METFQVKAGDIIYLKFNQNKTPAMSWPCLGSSFEIDCKVIEVHHQNTPDEAYKVISGHGNQLTVLKKYAVHPKDKAKFSSAAAYISTIDTELFPKDTVFYVNDEYVCNDEHGVYIGMTRFNSYQNLNYFANLK